MDVTHNLHMFLPFPHVIPIEEDLEIRGEAIMSMSVFTALNSTLEVPLANPRNAVSGMFSPAPSATCPRVIGSASVWPRPFFMIPKFWFWTNPPPAWIPTRSWRCAI